MYIQAKNQSLFIPTQKIWIVLPVPPTGNNRLTGSVRKTKTGKSYIGTRRSNEATQYQQTVKLLCNVARLKPFKCNVDMSIQWYRKIATGDVPDRWKDLCDALESYAYVNDSQIDYFSVKKWDTDKLNPRIEVTITPSE